MIHHCPSGHQADKGPSLEGRRAGARRRLTASEPSKGVFQSSGAEAHHVGRGTSSTLAVPLCFCRADGIFRVVRNVK
jgi:hypothetical protein